MWRARRLGRTWTCYTLPYQTHLAIARRENLRILFDACRADEQGGGTKEAGAADWIVRSSGGHLHQLPSPTCCPVRLGPRADLRASEFHHGLLCLRDAHATGDWSALRGTLIKIASRPRPAAASDCPEASNLPLGGIITWSDVVA